MYSQNSGFASFFYGNNIGCSSVILAGFDGYEYQAEENYESDELSFVMTKHQVDMLNNGMKQIIERYRKQIDLVFITDSRFS